MLVMNTGINHAEEYISLIKRDTCLCIGGFQAPPAPRFVFLITLSLLGGFFSNLAGVCSSPGEFFWNMLQ